MRINSVGTNLYTYKSNSTKKTVQNPVNVKTDNKGKTDKDKKKKILVSVGIAALLLLILFRKNIKNLFKQNPESNIPKKPENAGGKKGTKVNEGGGPDKPKGHGGQADIPKSQGSGVEQGSFNTDALMQEYRELCAKQKDPYTLKTDEEKRLWTEQDNRITALYNELRTNNVSFIVKEEYSLDPLVDREAKKAYLYSDKVALASTNEASKLDFLEMYEKYGERYYDPKEPWNSSISIISSSITSNGPTSDTVLRKYINYMDKIAVKDSQGLQDAVIINSVFANNIDSMSEATILKFIEVIKKTSFEQYEGITAKYAVESSSLKDSPKIKAAIDDLTDALKDYPYEVNSDQSVFH